MGRAIAIAVFLLARPLPLWPDSFLPRRKVELQLLVVIPPSVDEAIGAIRLALRLGHEVQRVVRLHLGLALVPGMREVKRLRLWILAESRVDRRVCFVGKGLSAKFLEIKFPRHGGGAGSKDPNNRLLENA